MFVAIALLTAVPSTLPFSQREWRETALRCGLVFNVDGSGPAGDGTQLDRDQKGFTISRRLRPDRRRCFTQWVRRKGLRVRYDRSGRF